jgi:hypothetical protein
LEVVRAGCADRNTQHTASGRNAKPETHAGCPRGVFRIDELASHLKLLGEGERNAQAYHER